MSTLAAARHTTHHSLLSTRQFMLMQHSRLAEVSGRQFATSNKKKDEAAPVKKATKKTKEASSTKLDTEKEPAKKTKKVKADKEEQDPQAKPAVHRMYTLKFNSPILPYSKFPLTQNKYMQDFLRRYDEDQSQVTRIIGVHFPNNNNTDAEGAVGIEIEITKKNNIAVVESNTNKRFKV